MIESCAVFVLYLWQMLSGGIHRRPTSPPLQHPPLWVLLLIPRPLNQADPRSCLPTWTAGRPLPTHRNSSTTTTHTLIQFGRCAAETRYINSRGCFNLLRQLRCCTLQRASWLVHGARREAAGWRTLCCCSDPNRAAPPGYCQHRTHSPALETCTTLFNTRTATEHTLSIIWSLLILHVQTIVWSLPQATSFTVSDFKAKREKQSCYYNKQSIW